MNGLRRLVRAAWRLSLLAAVFAGAAGEFIVAVGPRAGLRRRTQWLSQWCRRGTRALSIRVRVQGRPPHAGAVVANHLSYLDVLVFSAVNRQVFLAKSEIRRWPVIGTFTAWSGAPFIDRRRRSDVPQQHEHLRRIVAGGAVPTLFLEGTTTDGHEVLPFHSALLEPAARDGWSVTPAAIHFTCQGGDTARDVCWWGNMTLVGHLLRLVQLKSVTAHLNFGEPIVCGGDRKALAVQLREKVIALRAELEPLAPPMRSGPGRQQTRLAGC